MSAEKRKERSKLIDFAARSAPVPMRYVDHATLGDLTFCRCTFEPNPGMLIGTAQVVVGIHNSAPYELRWRRNDNEHSLSVKAGSAHITAAGDPIFLEWGTARPHVEVIAISDNSVRKILSGAGMDPDARLISTFGVRDRIIRQIAEACEAGIEEYGNGGRLFADGLALSLVTHLFHNYSDSSAPAITKGGLTPRDARRVLDYMRAHLHDDIGLEELAATVDLSTHYFTEAFRKAVGVPPYRYLLQQRVEKAKELLLNSDLPISIVSERSGFASQTQFTTNFKRLVGVTPARFRRENN